MQLVWGTTWADMEDFYPPKKHKDRWLFRLRWRAAEKGGVYSRSKKNWIGAYGLEPTPEMYIHHTVTIFQAVKRVLRDDGTLWLNLGDRYSMGGRGGGQPGGKQGTNKGSLLKPVVCPPGLKPKNLCGIPWRVALALQQDGAADVKAMQVIARVRDDILEKYKGRDLPHGVLAILTELDLEYSQAKGDSWYLRQDIIWHKPNPMPESCTDRCTKSHEYIFLLTKKPRYFYDAEAIKEESSEKESREGIRPRGEHKYSGTDWTPENRGQNYNRMEGKQYPTRNKRSVWTVTTKACKEAHFATFPPKLIEPCILAGTSKKGCCPECGAPWERVQESQRIMRHELPKSHKDYRPGRYTVKSSGADDYAKGGGQAFKQTKTTGWRPTCDCPGLDGDHWGSDCAEERDWPTKPCVVFDPFMGAGTTAMVAIQNGRDYAGTELSAEYIKIAETRIKAVNSGVPVAELHKGQAVMFT